MYVWPAKLSTPCNVKVLKNRMLLKLRSHCALWSLSWPAVEFKVCSFSRSEDNRAYMVWLKLKTYLTLFATLRRWVNKYAYIHWQELINRWDTRTWRVVSSSLFTYLPLNYDTLESIVFAGPSALVLKQFLLGLVLLRILLVLVVGSNTLCWLSTEPRPRP